MQKKILKFLKEPLLHFLLIGASFYLIYGLYGEPKVSKDRRQIVISAGELMWLQGSWKKRWNRPPTDGEMKGVIKQYMRELVLSREAIAMGLDKNDIVIRRRLVQKLEFLAGDLVELAKPTDEELADYMKRNVKRYEIPATATMTQIFYDPDKRGVETLKAAKSQKTILNSRAFDAADVNTLGDPFLLQRYYPGLIEGLHYISFSLLLACLVSNK